MFTQSPKISFSSEKTKTVIMVWVIIAGISAFIANILAASMAMFP